MQAVRPPCPRSLPSPVPSPCSRSDFSTRHTRGIVAAAAVVLLAGLPMAGKATAAPMSFSKIYEGYKYDSGGNELLHVKAEFTSSGNKLYLDLSNLGPASRSKADILTSFYFKLLDPSGGIAPKDLRLDWVSATGKAFQVLAGEADVAASWAPKSWTTNPPTNDSNLIAKALGDQGWQMRSDLLPTSDFEFTFGIGTVGNSGLSPYGFSGAVVNGTRYPGPQAGLAGRLQGSDTMINLGIYSDGGLGDINPNGGLDRAVLVRRTARFEFSSPDLTFGNDPTAFLNGDALFGFGTNPDHVIELPEPGTLPMAGTFLSGAVGFAGWKRFRRQNA
jgi:hypothetical protein